VTTYSLLKPLRVWRQHRSVKRQLEELAALEFCRTVHQGFYATA